MDSLLKRYAKIFAYGALLTSMLLMGWVAHGISVAKQQFASELITRSVAQTRGELNHFFGSVDHLMLMLGEQYDSGLWKDLPEEKSIHHHISLIRNYSQISSLGIADLRGYELNILPEPESDKWLTRRVFVDRWGEISNWSRWDAGDSLSTLDSWTAVLPVDTRERPWFRGAVRAGGDLYWTEPYEYTTFPELGITASMLLPHEVDSLARIMAIDLTLGDLNHFVEDLYVTENQHIFLLSSDHSQVIAFAGYSGEENLEELNRNVLPAPSEYGSPALLGVLEREDNATAFRFRVDGKVWWGMLEPYNISGNRQLHIVSVLPESDFALEIDRTQWTGAASFVLILLLSGFVVWNHNTLHRIGNTLSEKNRLIREQKKMLFSEVHHRVKNNLALISAFMELDLLNRGHSPAEWQLRRHMQRIRVIARIQEEIYDAPSLGNVPVREILLELADHYGKTTNLPPVLVRSEPVELNVNQAMTFGLLLNELIGDRDLLSVEDTNAIVLETAHRSGEITATVFVEPASSAGTGSTAGSAIQEKFRKLTEQPIARSLSRQLGAEIEFPPGQDLLCRIRFRMQGRKGVVSSRMYK